MLLRAFGRIGRSLCLTVGIAVLFPGTGQAVPYQLDGDWYDVDYWAGTGGHETVVVVDWNDTNGPVGGYVTESHAFGYRWDGTQTVLDAFTGIAAAGAFDFTGSAFIGYVTYDDGTDNHTNQTPTDYNGWVWLGGSDDGGATWTGNLVGADVETLVAGEIEGVNLNPGQWTGDNLTVPVPEPGTIVLTLGAMSLCLLRRRRVQ